jgi:hypothetical protein
MKPGHKMFNNIITGGRGRRATVGHVWSTDDMGKTTLQEFDESDKFFTTSCDT